MERQKPQSGFQNTTSDSRPSRLGAAPFMSGSASSGGAGAPSGRPGASSTRATSSAIAAGPVATWLATLPSAAMSTALGVPFAS
jgi:hypothetical protein